MQRRRHGLSIALAMPLATGCGSADAPPSAAAAQSHANGSEAVTTASHATPYLDDAAFAQLPASVQLTFRGTQGTPSDTEDASPAENASPAEDSSPARGEPSAASPSSAQAGTSSNGPASGATTPSSVGAENETSEYVAAGEVRVLTGTLASGDPRLSDRDPNNDDSYYHSYHQTFPAGARVTLLLESEAFDAYLHLLDNTDTRIMDADDIEEDNTNAQLEFIAEQDMRYEIIVNSYDAGETGDYRLTISVR